MQLRSVLLSATLATLAFGPAFAQEMPMEGPAQTTTLINVESKSHAALDPGALKLEVNGHGTPIDSVTPITPATTQVAILIDDGLRTSFDLQLRELSTFVTNLPAGTQVLLGYMENGTVRSSGHFSADHGEAINDLRIPFGSPGISASPYFCLSEFVKHWPSSQPAARVVLMLTNGVDPYNGRPSVLNQDSPYVQTAQDDAERAGAAVYSIYYPLAAERGPAVSFSGQSYLQQVADATGAQSFYTGTITPPSISPYLNQFARALTESYAVSFRASTNREKRDTLTRIKLKTSQSGVKVHAPESVHAGVSE